MSPQPKTGDYVVRLEDHPLVKAGEVHMVIETFRGGYLGFSGRVGGEWSPTGWMKCDADGWIPAPEGGWGENPVPGMRVDVRFRDGEEDFGVPSEFWSGASFDWWKHESQDPAQHIIALRLVSEVREKVEDEAGPAEKEVGRAVYERIEKLIKTDPNGTERGYLSHLVESVEEVGGYDGPMTPLSPANGEVAAAVARIWAALYRAEEIGTERVLFGRKGPGIVLDDLRTILTALRAQPNGGAK